MPRDQIFGLAQTNPDFDEFENKLITLAQYSIFWRPTSKAATFRWKQLADRF